MSGQSWAYPKSPFHWWPHCHRPLVLTAYAEVCAYVSDVARLHGFSAFGKACVGFDHRLGCCVSKGIGEQSARHANHEGEERDNAGDRAKDHDQRQQSKQAVQHGQVRGLHKGDRNESEGRRYDGPNPSV